ncbi:MAG: hypothetical protein Q8O03_09105 [Nanoarchaeota archaeon]|nr:hypothetical protein [Nanoarchaeota archaeon]
MKKTYVLILILTLTILSGCAKEKVVLNELQVTACDAASDNNNCERLDDLGIVSGRDCCYALSKCCGDGVTGRAVQNTLSNIPVDEFKAVLINAIKDYFSKSPVWTTVELKDLIVAYFSTTGDTVDLSGTGKYSGKKLIDIYNKDNKANGKTTCVPSTCSSLGKECGTWSDGCGGTLKCATCATGQCTEGKCAVKCVSDADCHRCGFECYDTEWWSKHGGPNTFCPAPSPLGFDCKCIRSVCEASPLQANCGIISHKAAVFHDATTVLKGPNAVFVSGNYAYVTSCESTAACGVQVLDVSNPAQPKPVRKIVDDDTMLLAVPEDIFVSGKYAYVLSRGTWESGLEILDISEPAQPKHAGKIADDANVLLAQPESIFVSGNYAYVTSRNEKGVEILDVSNPAQPKHAGKIVDDDTTLLAGAKNIFVSGKYAYVISENGLEILDISNPAQPKHAGKIADSDDVILELSDPRSIAVSGGYAYVAGGNVEILDVSNPAQPKHVAKIVNNPYSYSIDDSYAKGINFGDSEAIGYNGVTVYKNKPNNAVYHPLGGADDVFISGSYLYVIGQNEIGSIVTVWDISNPAKPKIVGKVIDDATTAFSYPKSIFVSGNYAYVAGLLDSGVEILSISSLTSNTICE